MEAKLKLTPMQLGIVLMAFATAAIHLALGIPNMMVMFILNGIGYIVLVIALYLPQLKSQQTWIRWALIAYTAVTILGWVFVGARNTIAYADKLIEVALIVLLFLDGRKK
jgi:hypothetical protein